jgi:NADH-quinone oxidoreductase subunit G
VDTNKDIVYRVRARYNPEAQGHFICDDGRYNYHFVNSADRIIRPLQKVNSQLQRTMWSDLLPVLRQRFAAAAQSHPASVAAVLSPFLTLEEAYLYSLYFKQLSPQVRLILGPVPHVGEDDRYPKDVRGNPVEPTKFTIRAEKCPNRLGVEAVLKHFQGEVIPFTDVASPSATMQAMMVIGGYPNTQLLESAVGSQWKAPSFLVVQDLLPSPLTAAADYVLPATSSYEKAGTYVNHASLAQTFARSAKPPVEIRAELQIAADLLGRPGLVQVSAIRKEMASAISAFADLNHDPLPASGQRLPLLMVTS